MLDLIILEHGKLSAGHSNLADSGALYEAYLHYNPVYAPDKYPLRGSLLFLPPPREVQKGTSR